MNPRRGEQIAQPRGPRALGYLANAGKVRTRGFEVDNASRPVEGQMLYANGAQTDATYVRFIGAPCSAVLAGGPTAAAGQAASAPGTFGGTGPAIPALMA